ncbi:MAG: DNA cytosine methyltransferase [Promethearchaeota archaeon]
MKILDLFCGAGGFSLGFADKRNKIIGIDAWQLALDTYEHNLHSKFKTCETVNADINDLDAGDLASVLETIDILIGSPPCQEHSITNRFRSHDSTLIEKYLEIKEILKPRIWIMENVPMAAQILENLNVSKAFIRFLKAIDFGLPHVRRRLFAGNYPKPTKIKNYQFIILPTPVAAFRGYGHGKEQRAIILEKCYQFTKENYPFLIDDDYDKNVYSQVISPTFYKLIMGFPAWYEFLGNKTDQYRQIGNAVCPAVSRAIYNAIKKKKKFYEQVRLI